MKKDKFQEMVRALSFVSLVSTTTVTMLAAGFFGGQWLETKLDIYPYGRIIGIVCGLIMTVFALGKYIRENFIDNKDRFKR